jgi:hypothetical protein
MREQHFFAKGMTIGGGSDGGGNTSQVAVKTLVFLIQNKRDERRPRLQNFQPELPSEIVTKNGCTDFGDGKAAGGHNEDGCAKFVGICSHREFSAAFDLLDFGVQKYLDAGISAFGLKHIGDVVRAAVAEKLAEGFLVIRNAMLFDERDEIGRSVTSESGFCKVFVRAEKILGAAMEIREIAAATARDQDFLADAIGPFEDRDAASTFAGLGRAEESRGTSA